MPVTAHRRTTSTAGTAESWNCSPGLLTPEPVVCGTAPKTTHRPRARPGARRCDGRKPRPTAHRNASRRPCEARRPGTETLSTPPPGKDPAFASRTSARRKSDANNSTNSSRESPHRVQRKPPGRWGKDNPRSTARTRKVRPRAPGARHRREAGEKTIGDAIRTTLGRDPGDVDRAIRR